MPIVVVYVMLCYVDLFSFSLQLVRLAELQCGCRLAALQVGYSDSVRVGVRVSISIYLIDVIKLQIGSVLTNNIRRSANPQSAFYPLPVQTGFEPRSPAWLTATLPVEPRRHSVGLVYCTYLTQLLAVL